MHYKKQLELFQNKTMVKIKHLGPALLPLVLLVSIATAFLITYPSQVSAQTVANKTDSCSTKINEAKCNAAVKATCTSTVPDRLDDCRKTVIGRYKDKTTTESCSVKIYKDECEAKVKETCTSTVPDRLDDCRKTVIGSFADSTSTPEDDRNDEIERQAKAFCGSDVASSPDGACRNGWSVIVIGPPRI
jgi:hypothetical protein